MNAYIDASVALRVVFGDPGRIGDWPAFGAAVSSDLIRVECLRAVDRARLTRGLADEEVASQRLKVSQLLAGFNLIPIERRILERAAAPFPTKLRTLDAIHLASALLARDRFEDLSLATHDDELALAARAMGFEVHG